MNSEKILKIENLTKDYYSPTGYKIRLFENLSFDIKPNEFTTIFAPEGSGKSTLLKILAGLEKEYQGKVLRSPEAKILLLPDKPDSFQWLSVAENIKFFAKNLTEKELGKIIADVGLEGYENHRPHPKSAGFRFRISLARALALKPAIVLIDDTLKNILNDGTRREILELLRELNFLYKRTTFIVATSNLTDAVFLGDKILLLAKHPSKLIAEIKNDLSENRNCEVMVTDGFEKIIKQCKEKILEFDSNLILKTTV